MKTPRLAILVVGVSWLAANCVAADEFMRANEKSPTAMSPRDIVLLADAELVRNAAEWIGEFSGRATGTRWVIGGRELLTSDGAHIVAVVGRKVPFKGFRPVPEVGSQGFVLQRVHDPKAGDVPVCWSPGGIHEYVAPPGGDLDASALVSLARSIDCFACAVYRPCLNESHAQLAQAIRGFRLVAGTTGRAAYHARIGSRGRP